LWKEKNHNIAPMMMSTAIVSPTPIPIEAPLEILEGAGEEEGVVEDVAEAIVNV
jgi:hypothetical protein